MNRRNGMTLAALTATAALALAGAGCGNGHAQAAQEATARDSRPKVTVAAPVTATITEFSEQTGRAEAPQMVDVRARVAGHIVRTSFKEGDIVKKGDLLFLIDPRPYQIAVARARADLESARADRELAKRNAGRAEELLKSNSI